MQQQQQQQQQSMQQQQQQQEAAGHMGEGGSGEHSPAAGSRQPGSTPALDLLAGAVAAVEAGEQEWSPV
jgi:hypothetical protein